MHSANLPYGGRVSPGASATPLHRFLIGCHAEIQKDNSGAVASYIPELKKSDPNHFGISLATIDGHIYEVGDCNVPFTIQSISKAFVFALALELLGAKTVEAIIGVEPSGDSFNSIRLRPDNRPHNPMVNTGAIACSGLIHRTKGKNAFDYIRAALGRFAVANNGVNPVTGEEVMKPYAVARTLSIMTSSGMYDFAGEWVYRVGMPAKSGVGGGIVAALPAQLGLGTFSPPLDLHGNSVRGLRICEALSAHFGLHMLNRTGDVRASIIADYDIGSITSRRSRKPRDQQILEEHHEKVRVIELLGALAFATIDYVSRRLAERPTQILIIDFRRVASLTHAAGLLLAEFLRNGSGATTTVLAGIEPKSAIWSTINRLIADIDKVRTLPLLDEAIEWAEDQIIFRYGGHIAVASPVSLKEQALLAGLTDEELADLSKLGTQRSYPAGKHIVSAGEPATSLFFLQSGMVSVKLPSGVRLASLDEGMAFGEMTLLNEPRSADVCADTHVACLELPIEKFNRFRQEHPRIAERIARNLAAILAKRLILANAKIDSLSAY
ncbi:MAG: glutaminase [Xanthobacteraceae bacterium]